MKLAFIISLVVLLVKDTFAVCPAVDGLPPRFITEPPASVVVSETVFQPACNVVANLVLPCSAAGLPAPSVSWFREETELSGDFVMADGTLAINITASDVPQQGVFYHCVASNVIGRFSNVTAQLRSRDVDVSHAFFDGFVVESERTLNLPTVEGGAVSLICDIRGTNPANPQIEWFADDVLLEEDLVSNTLLYLNNGRNLYIQSLSAAQRMMRYHCELVTFEGVRMRSPDTYVISPNLFNNGLTEYFRLDSGGNRVAKVGVPEQFVYAAAAIDGLDNRIDIEVSCPSTDSVAYSVRDQYVINATALIAPSFPPGRAISSLSLECTVTGNGISMMIFGTLFFIAPLSILPLPETGDDDFIMDRDRVIGGGPVQYSCATSRPVPIRWFRNGSPLASGSGIIVDNDTLTISNPGTLDSGIYQCSAINSVTELMFYEELQRVWFLEVTDPTIPTVAPGFCDAAPIATTINPAICIITTEGMAGSEPTTAIVPTDDSTEATTSTDVTTGESNAAPAQPPFIWMYSSLLIAMITVILN